MFEHGKIQNLEDFFLPLSQRNTKQVYFYRILEYNMQMDSFLCRYYEEARKNGVVIEGRIPNPTEKNLAYYQEIMGISFHMKLDFIVYSLKKWLPRLTPNTVSIMSESIYDTLLILREQGKNDNILKNVYIKFMCWLYYKFERIAGKIGENQIPKVFYDGQISQHELLLFRVLSRAGCDILLLEVNKNTKYSEFDPQSTFSYIFKLDTIESQSFPEGYSIRYIREKIQKNFEKQRIYGKAPKQRPCTNAWISGEILEDIQKQAEQRGKDSGFFYNIYARISGVKDKVTYLHDLYTWYMQLQQKGRKFLIIDHKIPEPSPDEIREVKRKNYIDIMELAADLSKNFSFCTNIEIQRLMIYAFIDIILEESKFDSLHKILNKAVYLICWVKRYQGDLFQNNNISVLPIFIYMMEEIPTKLEQIFLRFLSKLPVDIILFSPNTTATIKDDLLYEIHYEQSMQVNAFPREDTGIQMGTVAYHAERDLDEMLYTDSGIYRNMQFTHANSIVLKTMYEEIKLLWKEEARFRPNFLTVDNTVNIPSIFAKVSGVKDANIQEYWQMIRELITPDCLVISNIPYLDRKQENPIRAYVGHFYKNGRLKKSKIREHPSYMYGYLRNEVQDYILDKLELLLQQKKIKGIGSQGTEYTILSTILNLPTEVLRLLQGFDFTKISPKLIYIHTKEKIISLEDAIFIAFLNLVGFDILVFVPTGYQNIQNHYTEKIMEEHQIGGYLYDLIVPNLKAIPKTSTASWFRGIFGRR